jgi:uncharacterized protein (TIGR00106 family)
MAQVNIAFQILPISSDKSEMYAWVDAAIKVIQDSGLKYEVCPFETVIEGPYESVMAVIEKAQEACFAAGATDLLAYIKIQRSKDKDVSMEDKTGKYR